MKVPAMVIYPTLGGYINYCYGFSLIDLPLLNTFFSEKLTNQADISPSSFKMFYTNLNIASTYLLALLVFLAILVPLTAYTFYRQYTIRKNNKNISKTNIKNYKDLTGK